MQKLWKTGKTLLELKEHTVERHADTSDGGWIWHINLDINNFNEVTYTVHLTKDI